MSEADYNRIRSIPLLDLGRKLGVYELQRLIESSSPLQKQMILNALARR